MSDLEKVLAVLVGVVVLGQQLLLKMSKRKSEELQKEVFKEQLDNVDQKLKDLKEKTKRDEDKLNGRE